MPSTNGFDCRGKRCPLCLEEYETWSGIYWREYDAVPHANRDDCIKYLAKKLEDAVRRLEDHNL